MRRTPKSSWICLPLAKIQYLNEITNERGVVFATETPISNSMAELYTMQRYLKPSRLEKQDLYHFDAWASTFGQEVMTMEIDLAGRDGRPKTRVATNKIVALMESGKLPWQKGWDGKVGASIFHVPINGKSGRPYGSPLNSLYLSCIMAEKESDDPRFFSIGVLKQQNKIHKERIEKYSAEGKDVPKELLWEYRTKEGAKPTTVIQRWHVTQDKYGNELPADEQYWAKKYVTLYHASDCLRREYHRDAEGKRLYGADGKPLYTDHPLKEYVPKEDRYTHEEVHEIAEAILAGSGAIIKHDQADRAFYSLRTDEIHLPPKEAFPAIADYYATALHELAHWTRHASRLNRERYGEFGSPEYAREELRAELTSAFLSQEFGLPSNIANHAAYLQSWMKELKEDKTELLHAASDAKQIVGYMKEFIPAHLRKRTEETVLTEAAAPEKEMPKEMREDLLQRTMLWKGTLGTINDRLVEIKDTDFVPSHTEDSIHVTVFQPKDGKRTEKSGMRFLQDFDRVYDANFDRETFTLDRLYEKLNRDDRPNAKTMRHMSVGDLIEVDERIFRVSSVGFEEMQCHPYKEDFILTSTSSEMIQKQQEKAREAVGEDIYTAYEKKFHDVFYRCANPHLPIDHFAPPRCREMDADYAKEFRERAFLCGLSSLRPTDQKGWRDADAHFARRQMEAGIPFPRIAGAIQRNSPYAIISGDRAYGTKLARDIAAEHERERGRETAASAVR